MTRSLTRMQAGLLGLVVLTGLALALLGVFAIGDRQGLWEGNFHIQARFRQINGVEVGTRVRVQGINAGQVDAIEQPAERGGDVVLRIRLSRRFQPLLGGDARAQIVAEGLIGGKVIELEPGSAGASPLEPGATIHGQSDRTMEELRALAARSQALLAELETLTQQTAKAMTEAHELVREIRQGQGTVGKELIASLQGFQQTMDSMGRSFEALKHMPFVGQYVDTATDLLMRPNLERHLFTFRESELFDAGQAVLTPYGKGRLDAFALTELPRLKIIGSEIVIASYTDAPIDSRSAEVLTTQQSEAVRDYLLEQHRVQKISFWRRRDVTAVGLGQRPAPGGRSASTPARRTEIVVFIPPGSIKETASP